MPNTTTSQTPVAPLGDGAYLASLHEQPMGGELLRDIIRLVRVDPVRGDSILDEYPPTTMWVQAGSATSYTGVPAPGGQFGVDPHGNHIVIAHQSREDPDAPLRIRRLDSQGRVRYSRWFEYEPMRRPASYLRDIFAGRDEQLRRQGVSAAEMVASLDRVMTRNLIPVREIRVAVDGSTWLKREDEPGDMVWWNVLDPQGGPVANVRLPKRVEIRYIDGDAVWGFDRDDLGVWYLVRYRVDRG